MVKKNIIANFLGSAWVGLIALLFIPSYIALMGAEAFALIGLFIAFTNLLAALDFGISPTLNRELAAASVHHETEKMRNTLRTLEILYIGIIALVIIVLLSLSFYLADSWLKNNQLSTATVRQSLQLMGVVIALHLLGNFYSAGLSGLQHQVQVNIINMIMATLRYAAVVPLMHFISASPLFFFGWQLLIGLLHVTVVAVIVWSKIPMLAHRPVFHKEIIRRIWQFSAGVSLVSIIGLLTAHLDRILLSRWLSLEAFGYYTVASVIAMSIAPRIASPFFAAMYPRFTQYFKQGEVQKIHTLYHTGSFSLALLLIPISLFITVYAPEVLQQWTHDAQTVSQAAPVLRLLALGGLFHGMMYIPYALQLAHGETKIALAINLVSFCLALPMMWLLYTLYGSAGIAFVWLFVMACAILFGVYSVHLYILEKQYRKWLLYDNGLILLIVLPFLLATRLLFEVNSLTGLGITLAATLILPAMLIFQSRTQILNILRRHFST
ncbi:oligosaccharide flippase family protein [Candidatus Venteria ishoeyi]|uniref:Colanic acid exporter n=1 Tax=Candidatus Venteria ishoeyi TaxID=1899563 RepID=A0A1H6F476_9GAMM|nr:oligosaccharide flippase family protein [Candidatus Venteria ishoeyi]SEH04191.1 colanic acid exporter [Candidatus Venteria ishoeyi]